MTKLDEFNESKPNTAAMVTLEKYIEKQLALIERATELRASALKESLASIYATRAEMCDEIDKLTKDIKELNEYKSLTEGKANASSVIYIAAATFVSVLLSLVALIKDFVK